RSSVFDAAIDATVDLNAGRRIDLAVVDDAVVDDAVDADADFARVDGAANVVEDVTGGNCRSGNYENAILASEDLPVVCQRAIEGRAANIDAVAGEGSNMSARFVDNANVEGRRVLEDRVAIGRTNEAGIADAAAEG